MAFQRRRVHSHQDVGEVARRMHALANVHLKSRDTAQSALRSADFSRIVGESGDLVAHARRHVRENVAGEPAYRRQSRPKSGPLHSPRS